MLKEHSAPGGAGIRSLTHAGTARVNRPQRRRRADSSRMRRAASLCPAGPAPARLSRRAAVGARGAAAPCGRRRATSAPPALLLLPARHGVRPPPAGRVAPPPLLDGSGHGAALAYPQRHLQPLRLGESARPALRGARRSVAAVGGPAPGTAHAPGGSRAPTRGPAGQRRTKRGARRGRAGQSRGGTSAGRGEPSGCGERDSLPRPRPRSAAGWIPRSRWERAGRAEPIHPTARRVSAPSGPPGTRGLCCYGLFPSL